MNNRDATRVQTAGSQQCSIWGAYEVRGQVSGSAQTLCFERRGGRFGGLRGKGALEADFTASICALRHRALIGGRKGDSGKWGKIVEIVPTT
ncbi:MAG: hypothetical protein P8Q26_14335 [Ascidiaceihabitans sp.]|nr:hypothetical protein [Ascidiaceihabitans sp.]